MPRHGRYVATHRDPGVDYYGRLSDLQRRLVDEYLVDLNAFAAGLRAGYSCGTSAANVMRTPAFQRALAQRRDLLDGERIKSASGAQFVLGKLWDVATADPRDIVAVHHVPCRYCNGIDGRYQFTQIELDRLTKAYEYGQAGLSYAALWPSGAADRAAYEAGKNKLPFDSQGGGGYNTHRPVNANCTECAGHGVVVHYIADTRHLGHAARQLYRGCRVTRNGIEILMADQDAARDILARHYGVGVERKELLVRNQDPSKLSDADLQAAIAELEAITLNRGQDYNVVDMQRERAQRARLLPSKKIGRPTR